MTERLRRSKKKKETQLKRSKKPSYQKDIPDFSEQLDETTSRSQAQKQIQELDEEFKMKRLAKRLNITIIILIGLIILVYLFMRFVNF